MCNEVKDFEERKKDLFQKMIGKEDVKFLLKVLDEGGTKGTEQFQRMKLRNLLKIKNAQRGKKFSPWDYIKKTVCIPHLKEEDKADIVRYLRAANEVPQFVRYITLMVENEAFFNEHFETFYKNVEDGKDFLSGTIQKRNQEEVEAMILNEFHKNEDELKEAVTKFSKLISFNGDKVLEVSERLKELPLEEYEVLEQELIEEGYSSALILFVYLIVGCYSEEIQLPLYYLAMERFAKETASDKLEEVVKGKAEKEVDETQKDKGIRKQLKKVTQDKKRLEEELEEVKGKYEEEKALTLEKINHLQKEVKELIIKDDNSQKQLEQYKRQIGGYSLNLADDLSVFKVVVAYTSPLLYAPIIFPDLTFLNVQELSNGIQKQGANLVILQKNGLSFMDYRKVNKTLKEKNIPFVEIDAIEERGVIMKVSSIMQEQLELESSQQLMRQFG